MNNIKIIAFDADDTLWANESYFQETEAQYCRLLENYGTPEHISQQLLATEMRNIDIYGYGVKSFTLSMIETAIKISGRQINPYVIEQIIGYGKKLLNMPVEPLAGVVELLEKLKGKYKLVVATKGDLLDQQRKLEQSGLQDYFHHVEIMSEKNAQGYHKLLYYLGCTPETFMMVGNSLKSDILPVLEVGGYAAYVPFNVTWAFETVEEKITDNRFLKLNNLIELTQYVR